MDTFIALLRAINVNGRNRVPMAELRAMAERLGHRQVVTYIQSGNLILASADPPAAIRSGLEAAIRATFGHEVAVALRRPEEVRAVLEGCPYRPGDGEVVYVAFAARAPAAEALAALPGRLPPSGDLCQARDEEIYILYRDGVHGSRLSNAFFERQLGVPFTSRSLGTVGEVLRRAGG